MYQTVIKIHNCGDKVYLPLNLITVPSFYKVRKPIEKSNYCDAINVATCP